jgi:ABC-type uncharacterized transport system ATPase subunit
VQAVDGVDLELHAGEIHALVGENGAGKSTLAAIAFGAVIPDEGTVETHAPVGLVHQHFQLVDRLRVWENVLLGREPRKRLAHRSRRGARTRAPLAAEHGLEVDPDALHRDLPIGVQQRVELLRELERRPGVLLLDEPTAALAPTEIASFFKRSRARQSGAAVLIVTHKLQEVIDYSTRVTVMRSGKRRRALRYRRHVDRRDRARDGRRRTAAARRTRRDGAGAALGRCAASRRAAAAACSSTARSRCAPARSSASRASRATANPRSPTRWPA